MKNWFFYKLYVFDKRLFFLVTIFTAFTIICNIKGDEITPFFIWAMYSQKEDTTNKYQVYSIRINDSILVDYSSGHKDNNRLFLYSPLHYYYKIQQNDFIDPTLVFLKSKLGSTYPTIQPFAEKICNSNNEQKMFTSWYKKYLEQTLGLPIHKLRLDVLNVHFMANQQLQTDSSRFIAAWEQ